jgi:hypothetical protein
VVRVISIKDAIFAMKYALVEGQRQEAQPRHSGICPACGSLMIARCGEVRMSHWAHRGERNCDTWWENETEWHRSWKNQFPVNWQEVVHSADNGERHIADVKTDQGWVLEFQHSKIHPEERKSREIFYSNLVWIVHGWRKRDKPQFSRALQDGRIVAEKLNMFRIPFPDECGLLKDWSGSSVPVLFDFSEQDKPQDTQLWCFIRLVKGMAYVLPFSREDFIKYHSPEAKEHGLDFLALWRCFNTVVELLVQSRPASPNLMAFVPPKGRMQRSRRL